MKKVIFSILFLLVVSGGLTRCDNEQVNNDSCPETPNCIPELSNWKLSYEPYNSDCMKCHTTCTPNKTHNFCVTGRSWNATEAKCLKCHSDQHK